MKTLILKLGRWLGLRGWGSIDRWLNLKLNKKNICRIYFESELFDPYDIITRPGPDTTLSYMLYLGNNVYVKTDKHGKQRTK